MVQDSHPSGSDALMANCIQLTGGTNASSSQMKKTKILLLHTCIMNEQRAVPSGGNSRQNRIQVKEVIPDLEL